MKKYCLVMFVLMGVLLSTGVSLALSGEEIMQKVDDFQFANTVKMEATMVIVNGKRQMDKTMLMLAAGDSALVEFTNARDRGTKFLKIKEDLWMFFPDAEEVVKISGHMLEQGMMGSDFSYQDAMEEEKLTDLYHFTVLKEEMVGDRKCYVIEAVAKEDVKVSYYRRLSWVDQERYVILQEELYAQSGKLLKLISVNMVEKFGERWYVTDSVMVNKLKKDTRTEFKISSIEFNVEIPEDTFRLQNLR